VHDPLGGQVCPGLADRLRPSPVGVDGPRSRVGLQGTPTYRCVIGYSGDRMDWIPPQTNLLGTSRLEIIGRGATGAAERFYRPRAAGF